MTESVAWGQLKQTADDAIRPLDVGTYLFLCSKAEHRRASTGAHMVVANLNVQGGPKHGKSLMHNFVFSPDNSFALAMWFRNFEAFGIDSNFFTALTGNLDQDMPMIANALVGRSAMGTVSIRKFQGQDRNQFDSFAPAVGVNMAAVTGSTMPMPSPSIPTPAVSVPSSPGVPGVPGVPQGIPTPTVPSAYEVATGTPQGQPAPSVPAVPAAAPVMQQPMATPNGASQGVAPPPDDPF